MSRRRTSPPGQNEAGRPHESRTSHGEVRADERREIHAGATRRRAPSAADKAMARHLRTATRRPSASRILGALPDGVAHFDLQWRYVYVNRRASQILGRPARELIGHVCWDLFPETRHLDSYERYHTAMATQEDSVYEEFAPFLGRWLEHRLLPSPDGLTVIARDITDWRAMIADRTRLARALAERPTPPPVPAPHGRVGFRNRVRIVPRAGAREAILSAYRETGFPDIALRQAGCISADIQLEPGENGAVLTTILWASHNDYVRWSTHRARLRLVSLLEPLIGEVHAEEHEVSEPA